MEFIHKEQLLSLIRSAVASFLLVKDRITLHDPFYMATYYLTLIFSQTIGNYLCASIIFARSEWISLLGSIPNSFCRKLRKSSSRCIALAVFPWRMYTSMMALTAGSQ